MSTPPPLRFLGLVLGGWACARAALLMPDWAGDVAEAKPQTRMVRAADRAPMIALAEAAAEPPPAAQPALVSAITPSSMGSALEPPTPAAAPMPLLREGWALKESGFRLLAVPPQGPWFGRKREAPNVTRWSASAWAFVRPGEAGQLAAAGLLGGSQIGGRFSYRIGNNPARPLALSGRVYAPLKHKEAAEAALGIEWQPAPALPVRVLAERRQAIGEDGRSAFSLLAYSGVSDVPIYGPLRLEAYGQAGVVGMRSRDLFVDASMSMTVPLSERLSFGAGIWAAAQPGAARVDVGPSLSLRLPIEGRHARISADWRFRAEGNASPRSGPAITLGSDF